MRSSAMYKDSRVENDVAKTGRDLFFWTTASLSKLSMPLTGEVGRLPEPSARPADSEERHICRTCLLADSVGLC